MWDFEERDFRQGWGVVKTTKNRASNTNFLFFTNNIPREDRTKHSGNDEASTGLKEDGNVSLW